MIRKENGFTMVELLVTVALTGLVMAVIYKSFSAQQKLYVAQDQVAAMQQDLRAAMEIMVRNFRLAGYDPTGTATATFTTARAGSCQFSVDMNGDGVLDSPIRFALTDDADGNGTADRILLAPPNALNCSLGMTSGGVLQPIADNIEAVGFAYAFDNNLDGKLDVGTDIGAADTDIVWAVCNTAPPATDLDLRVDKTPHVALASTISVDRIRAVKIWVLERSQTTDRDFRDGLSYTVAERTITPTAANNQYRRRLFTATVKCRNMGLAK